MFGWFKSQSPPVQPDQMSIQTILDSNRLYEGMRDRAKEVCDRISDLAEWTVGPRPDLTPAQREALVDQQFDLLFDAHEQAEAQALYQSRAEAQRHTELIEAIDNLSAEVRRGAVVANAVDFAKAHPFLAGVFGAHLLTR